ncbi:transposase [Neorhizobium galegae]|uniref:transposase n=1 Tax=Neorhizobium galegae TaxID=399 RepID=UPI00351EED26
MTKHPIEVITSVERRRRWSLEGRRAAGCACLEPDAVLSEIARAGGIHVNRLFRWRRELCRVDASVDTCGGYIGACDRVRDSTVSSRCPRSRPPDHLPAHLPTGSAAM